MNTELTTAVLLSVTHLFMVNVIRCLVNYDNTNETVCVVRFFHFYAFLHPPDHGLSVLSQEIECLNQKLRFLYKKMQVSHSDQT